MSGTTKGSILIVDDEPELRAALVEALSDEGYDVREAASGEAGILTLERSDVDVVLTDLMMPGMDGIQFLRQAFERSPGIVGIIMTGQGTIPTAVEAMKAGAFDYILKPFNRQTILPTLARAVDVHRLRTENVRLRQFVRRLNFESPRYQMVGNSAAMKRVMHMIEKVAPTDSTVVIRGESGTGKELVARALHYNSPRCEKPLVTINCAALQETLLESELFGHEKGAFTGATASKPGLFEVAADGTLFIDEVAEMAPGLQAKLLRVLEDGHYRRIGSIKECHSNARVIAATNKALEEEMKAGRFREDLYFRLNVVTIQLPPLRERTEDIPSLVEHLLTVRSAGGGLFRVAPDAMAALVAHHWPGNIRELANVLERAQILAENNEITVDDLPDAIVGSTAAPEDDTDNSPTFNLDVIERRTVRAALSQTKGNKVHAAKLLGVSRRALYRLIEKHRIPSENEGPADAGKDESRS